MKISKDSHLQWNIATHDNLARKYEAIHGEIYNEYEQARLQIQLGSAIEQINSVGKTKVALDFGCGAGNLTKHLSNLGLDVIATDVSIGFLNLVGSKKHPREVKTIQLNGYDLSNIPNESVDMVATYSVLHHIPDYLGILHEFMRVLKKGGVVYIDHEHSDEFWQKSEVYKEFRLVMKKYIPFDFSKYFVVTNYYDWLIRRFFNPRYHREGDIHVFDDDHIDWEKIKTTLIEAGGEVITSKNYLLFRRNFNIAVYDKYKEKTTDMHVLVLRKK